MGSDAVAIGRALAVPAEADIDAITDGRDRDEGRDHASAARDPSLQVLVTVAVKATVKAGVSREVPAGPKTRGRARAGVEATVQVRAEVVPEARTRRKKTERRKKRKTRKRRKKKRKREKSERGRRRKKTRKKKMMMMRVRKKIGRMIRTSVKKMKE